MSVDNRTVVGDTLDLMIKYCNDTAFIVYRIGTIEALKGDVMNQYALTGPIQQIGESTGRIDIWLENHYSYQWSKVIGFRNILSHNYDRLDLDILWGIATEKVPEVLNILLELKEKAPSYPDEDYLYIGSRRSR